MAILKAMREITFPGLIFKMLLRNSLFPRSKRESDAANDLCHLEIAIAVREIVFPIRKSKFPFRNFKCGVGIHFSRIANVNPVRKAFTFQSGSRISVREKEDRLQKFGFSGRDFQIRLRHAAIYFLHTEIQHL